MRTQNTIDDFETGQRVQLHPATDAWMSGDRYGTVEGAGRGGKTLKIRMDRSGKVRQMRPDNLMPV